MPLLLWLVILIQDGSPISPPVTSSLSPQDFECVYDYTQRTEEHAYMIKCASNTICIPSSCVCNGNEDCEDGSDEVNCNEDPETRQLQLNKILCSREEYRCQDVTGRCIPLDQTCDGVHHCRVHDDEDQQKCNDCKIKKCGYKCRITEYGGECYCPDGSNLNNDDRTCSSIDYCQTDPAKRCQQYCKNEENGYRCYCAEKYLLDDDDHTCHVEGGDDIQFVIAAGKREIITIPLVNKSNDVYTMEHKYMRENPNYPDDQGYTRVLAYNNHDDAIYLVSREYRTHADLTAIVNNTEKVFRRDLYGPASITVDYVGGNIFYTQTYHSKPGIYICAADGIFCRRIVAGKEVIPFTDYLHFYKQVVETRTHQLSNLSLKRLWAMGAKRQFYAGIALNPFTGKMVYIDIYGNTKLMMANMDGTDIDELYDNGDVFIHGLAIDPFKDEVYFGNWYGYTIMRMNLKTKQRHTVVSKGAGWVYELNYFNGYLYWTCLTGKLKSARISTPNAEGKTLRQFKEFVSGLGIKHPHYQPMHPVNPCAEVAKTCPWMCVIVPGGTPGTVKGKCLCPDNYKEEEGSCIPDRNITKTKHVHLLEAHSYVDVDYWKELCSKGTACLNGGQCAKIDENLNGTTGETHCDCPVPFVGERCEVADPYASGSGWTIFWILLFIVMLAVTVFGIYYHKYGGKVNEFPREPIVRLLRRNNHSEVQFILDEANSRPELQLSQVPASFSSPLFVS